MESLDLSSNRLTSVPGQLPPNLTSLDLSDNWLSGLRLGGHPKLRRVDLSANRVYLGEFDLPGGLEEFNLSGNAMREWSLSSDSLRVLDLSWNALERWEADSLGRLPSLGVLLLRGNPLRKAEARLDSKSLADLDLSAAQLRAVSGQFLDGLPALRTLDLSHNRNLHRLPGLTSAALRVSRPCVSDCTIR